MIIVHSEAVVIVQQYLTYVLIIFLVGTLGGKLAGKLRLPDVAIFIVIGMILGPFLKVIDVPAESIPNQLRHIQKNSRPIQSNGGRGE